MVRRLRIVSQILFFTLFLYLLARTQYNGTDTLGLPVRLFLEIDPLHFFSTLFSSGVVAGLMWLALILLALTLVFGRFFCGWICPLGATIQLVQKLPARNRRRLRETNRWRPSQRIKFFLLAALLVVSVAGLQITGWFDPLSLMIRSMALVVLPGIEHAARILFNAAYVHNPLGIADVSEPIYTWLQGRVISFTPPQFQQTIILALIFFGILALSFVRSRFWCRVLCPLGALLGLTARLGLFRIRQVAECVHCDACVIDCQGAAEPDTPNGWRPTECVVCGNCVAACGREGLKMGFARPHWRVARQNAQPEPFAGAAVSRRQVLIAGLAGLAAAPVLRLGRPTRPVPELIRPPGSLPESDFLERCIRCGECMKVCLTHGLQPTLLEAGLEGLWTPHLVPRIGYCEVDCTLCGQVCPTQAIRRLTLEEKRKTRIGLASIDVTRCLPYAYQRNCMVCEEHCPLPRKAIWFEEVAVVNRQGQRVRVKQPRVDLELCIGCGICEAKCVLQDRPAILVTSANEDRDRTNRVLLDDSGAFSS